MSRHRTPRVGRPEPRDEGIATVWAAVGVSVIMIALLVGLHLGAAVAARHRAEAAADLAALAAAGVAVEGARAACDRAGEIAAAMGGTLASCRLASWDALVEVRVPIPMPLPGLDEAAGRARAGPDSSETQPASTPPDAPSAPPSGTSPLARPAGLREDPRSSARRAVDGGRRVASRVGPAGTPVAWTAAGRLGAPPERSSSHRYR